MKFFIVASLILTSCDAFSITSCDAFSMIISQIQTKLIKSFEEKFQEMKKIEVNAKNTWSNDEVGKFYYYQLGKSNPKTSTTYLSGTKACFIGYMELGLDGNTEGDITTLYFGIGRKIISSSLKTKIEGFTEQNKEQVYKWNEYGTGHLIDKFLKLTGNGTTIGDLELEKIVASEMPFVVKDKLYVLFAVHIA